MTEHRYRDLRLTRHEAVWRGRRLEVVRPLLPVHSAYPVSLSGLYYVFADARSCLRLASLAWYAALHKEALVHVPLRGPAPPTMEGWVGHPVRACDLVFAHHSLAFRSSAWRDVRNRLGSPTPFTATIERPGEWLWERFDGVGSAHESPHRDVLDLSLHAETIFLAGSFHALGFVAAAFYGMSRSTTLYDHIHLRGAGRHRYSPAPEREDDLIISHYSERKARE